MVGKQNLSYHATVYHISALIFAAAAAVVNEAVHSQEQYGRSIDEDVSSMLTKTYVSADWGVSSPSIVTIIFKRHSPTDQWTAGMHSHNH